MYNRKRPVYARRDHSGNKRSAYQYPYNKRPSLEMILRKIDFNHCTPDQILFDAKAAVLDYFEKYY